MYAFVEKNVENTIVIFKLDDVTQAVNTLNKKGISVLTESMVQNLDLYNVRLLQNK